MDTKKLTQLFPSTKFKIVINNQGTDIVSVIIINKTEEDPVICVKFTIKGRIIELNSLLKCRDTDTDAFVTGTALLTKVETFAKEIGITDIILYDESKINICGNQINLAHFKILTTGMSWYNKLGYFSRNHEYDMRENSAFIELPIAAQLQPEITKTFPPTLPDETVKSYVTRIFTPNLQQEPICTQEDKTRGEYLHTIVQLLKDKISYNTQLTKHLTRQQRAGRRKLRTKRKKPNKKKRTRKHK